VDRFIYVAMTGASEALKLQATNSHNLANVSTTGFRADLALFQARQVAGAGYPTRAYATAGGAGWNSSIGAVQTTGRPLDVAVDGPGWIAVQARDGREAYTRAGDLRVDADGLLTNGAGHPVLGDGGPIVLPPYASLAIGVDGSVSIVPQGQGPETVAQVALVTMIELGRRFELAVKAMRTAEENGAAASQLLRVQS
jgi:flagellar basal-body rod protein FlgF